MVSVVSLCAAAILSLSRGECMRDDGCSLLGVCDTITHRCTCDAGWHEPDCGVALWDNNQ